MFGLIGIERLDSPGSQPHINILTARLFGGIVDIHGFRHRIPFYFNRLSKNQACNNRRNYLIII